ncbi:AAA family ATPase [Microbacterium hominis]|uniref:AAA family ATPase n=1 Tax=Microbacterium hominis TaxID=162426 RepID=A0A7D4PPN1_9MICO|nr:AAA family ATPase [Microbacterium hominis]
MIEFTTPLAAPASGVHHEAAAAGNAAVADAAARALREALSRTAPIDRILLKAAAGAGKSYVLKRLVAEALEHPQCTQVSIVAFTNKQTRPLARSLGKLLGKDRVCLRVSAKGAGDVPPGVADAVTVAAARKEIPSTAQVMISTVAMLRAPKELWEMEKALGGKGANGERTFDVLFVDEAWQIPHHLFDDITRAAPIWVGVGDVGQLPPLEIGTNPWRGDDRYNPYRAWPTDYDGDSRTWSRELPAVWRPNAAQLGLWRAFYPEWSELNCVAAPGDRTINLSPAPVVERPSARSGTAERGDAKPAITPEAARAVWDQVATGTPTILEIDGLDPAEAPDVDLPLMNAIEALLDHLFTSGVSLGHANYDDNAAPDATLTTTETGSAHEDPIVSVLATRNQAVDDAADMVARLREKHDLAENDLVSSTVDSYQGQTNGITVALHPLTGAAKLDDFNSAFGRLAVTCTRATHGLLLVARPGLDTLLQQAPARPGTPFGEPGNRTLPRQTHQRILATFARGTLDLTPSDA